MRRHSIKHINMYICKNPLLMRYLTLIAAMAVLFISSCDKNDTTTPTNTAQEVPFNVVGLTETSIGSYDSTFLVLSIEQKEGVQEQKQASLSVNGLPEDIGYYFSAQSGTPTFATKLTLQSSLPAAGKYSPTLVVTPKDGTPREYPFTLNVTSTAPTDCVSWMEGNYKGPQGTCAENQDISIFSSSANQVYIQAGNNGWRGLPPGGAVIADVDCSTMTFKIQEHRLNSTDYLNGTGKILGKNKLEITVTTTGYGTCTVIY